MSRHPTVYGRCNSMTKRSIRVGFSGSIFMWLNSLRYLECLAKFRRTPYSELLTALLIVRPDTRSISIRTSFRKLAHFQDRSQKSLILKPDQKSELTFSGPRCCPRKFPLCLNELTHFRKMLSRLFRAAT